MKVAFFEFNQNPWHLGLAFELAQHEIFQGNQVEFYFLGHSVEENHRNIYIRSNRLIRKSLLPESRIGRRLEKNSLVNLDTLTRFPPLISLLIRQKDCTRKLNMQQAMI